MERTPGSGASSADSPTAPAYSTYATEADARDLASFRGEPTTRTERDSSSPAESARADSEAATAAPSTTDPATDAAGAAPKPSRNLDTRRKQVDEDVAKLQESIRLRKALREELAALGPAKPQDSQPAPKADAASWRKYSTLPGAPKVEDFDAYEDFVDARAEFIADRRFEERERQRSLNADSERRMAETEQTYGKFRARVDEARKADPEIENKIDPGLMSIVPSSALLPNEPLRPANVLLQNVVESEAAPELLVHFSTPAGQQDWSNMLAAPTPAAMLRAFGRIEARFLSDGSTAKASTPAPKPVTSAPEPPTALGRRSSTADPASAALAKGDYAGYRAAADAADLAKFRGR